MKASQRQTKIYDTWKNTDHNLLIQAVAGSGKTTTLMHLLSLCEYRTLFLAFNKSIQEEIASKIEKAEMQHAKALTLHSLGLSSIRYDKRKVIIDSSKNYKLLKHLQEYEADAFSNLSIEEKVRLKFTLMDMNDVSRIFVTDDVPEIIGHMRNMDKTVFEHPSLSELWDTLKLLRRDMEDQGIIDYTDMIYIPVRDNLLIPIQPYYLFVDEAQDLNLAQHKMIDNLINQGDVSKWIAVGDRNQSIYGFSGAFGASFDLFAEKDNVVSLPLDVNYRCPQRVVKEANKVYDVMVGHKDYEGVVSVLVDYNLIKPGSLVICRNTSPLVELYFRLLSKDKSVVIKGEDIYGSLVRFLSPYRNKTVRQAEVAIERDIFRLEKKVKKSEDENIRLYRMKENFKNFSLLSGHLAQSYEKISDVLERIKITLEQTGGEESIVLCTIHKAKGLEADFVYILNEDLIPSKFAKSPMQLEQETNLKYVARTRAKEEMYYLNIKFDE